MCNLSFGIFLINVTRANVTDNVIISDSDMGLEHAGIFLKNSTDCVINHNSLQSTTGYGWRHPPLYIFFSFKIQITGNSLISETTPPTSDTEAIVLDQSPNCIVRYNTIERFDWGIRIGYYYDLLTTNCTIEGNTCFQNHWGIYVQNSRNSITDNLCTKNSFGIYVHYSDDNYIAQNTCTMNEVDGMYMDHSDNNSIYKNTFSDNLYYGIRMKTCYYNHIWENVLLNNTKGPILDQDGFLNVIEDNQIPFSMPLWGWVALVGVTIVGGSALFWIGFKFYRQKWRERRATSST